MQMAGLLSRILKNSFSMQAVQKKFPSNNKFGS
jgi:hypothetical protein